MNPTLEQLVARDALAKGIPGCLHSREHQRRFARRAVETAAGCYTTGLMANANPVFQVALPALEKEFVRNYDMIVN